MFAYVKTLIAVALRKLGPEDLPDSQFLLGLTLVVYLLLQIPLVWIVFGTSTILVEIIAVDVAMLITGLWVLLRLTGFESRFRQTLTALLGTSALLSILSTPFSLWRQFGFGSETAAVLPIMILFAIMLWSVSIDGHIISRALSKSYGIGLAIAVLYLILHTLVLRELIQMGMNG